MHAGLLSLWVTGALLLPNCLGDDSEYADDDSEYVDDDSEYVTTTEDYTIYTDYSFEYESDEYTTTPDYGMYVTPNKGIKHGQRNIVRDEPVHGGTSKITDGISFHWNYEAKLLFQHENAPVEKAPKLYEVMVGVNSVQILCCWTGTYSTVVVPTKITGIFTYTGSSKGLKARGI